MKQQIVMLVLGIFILTILFVACTKEEAEENAEEVITTMKLIFVPAGGGTTLAYEYDDPDGPGGITPTKQEIVLAPSKTYTVTVQLLNKTATPAEDITLEVQAESAAHRFYYEPSAGSNITVSGLNNDGNSIPLGITSTWTTGAVANGTLKVTLRHYPGNPPGKELADPVNSSKSSTDIEVIFTTKIQ